MPDGRVMNKTIPHANTELLVEPLSHEYKIYADSGQPATLNNGAGVQTDCATLQEAVSAWHRLAPEQKIRATVKVIGGPVYRAYEIDRLDYEQKPG
jgi:hypothetical protein